VNYWGFTPINNKLLLNNNNLLINRTGVLYSTGTCPLKHRLTPKGAEPSTPTHQAKEPKVPTKQAKEPTHQARPVKEVTYA